MINYISECYAARCTKRTCSDSRGRLLADVSISPCASFVTVNVNDTIESPNADSVVKLKSLNLHVMHEYLVLYRGRNKPKLPLVRRISDMLQTTCPPTCPLVQRLVHFVGPKLDALYRQKSMGLIFLYILSEVFELEIVMLKYCTGQIFPICLGFPSPLDVRHLAGYRLLKCQCFARFFKRNYWLTFNQNSHRAY